MRRSDEAPLTYAAGPPITPAPFQQESLGLDMLRLVVATARTLTHADAVALLLYDREHGLSVPTIPRVAVGLDERWLQSQGLAAAQTLAQHAAAAQAVLDLADTRASPELDLPLLAGGLRPGAVCVAPLMADEHLVGVLELYDLAPRAAPLDAVPLRSFAAMAAAAITASCEHEREHALRLRLEALDAATQAVAADRGLDRVLQRIVEAATTVVGARYGALGVLGADGNLSDFITVGLSAEERARLGPLPRGHGLLGVLIREGVPLRVSDMGHDPRRVGFPPFHPPMASLLGVPIRAHEQVVGDLYLTDKIGAPAFSAEDQRLVEMLATHAGIAIEHARLNTREQEWRRTLLLALDAQRQQAATLREQAELLDLAHDAIIVRDPESRVVSWNQGAQETYGWSNEEAVGQVTHRLLRTSFPSSREEADGALLTTGTWEGELGHVRQDGTPIVVESRQALVRDEQGAPQAILEINRDISVRKQAEATLRFLAEVGTALGASLDGQTTLTTLAQLAVPHLGDWCGTFLLVEDGDLRPVALVQADPAQADLAPVFARACVPQPGAAAAALIEVVQGGRSVLIAEVSEAQLVRMAADTAHLAVLRRLGLVSWLVVPLVAQGQLLGAMSLATAESGRRYGPEDLRLAEEVAARAALAVANARLHGQVGQLTQDRERGRIARELHDGIIQDLFAASLQLEDAAEDQPDAARQDQLLRIAERLIGVIGDIRSYIQGLKARALAGRTLSEGIAMLVNEMYGRRELAATWRVEGTEYVLPEPAATALLQVTREALANVVKHAQATAAAVHLRYEPTGVTLTVSDDGQGFEPGASRGAEHHGLRNLRARAEEMDGTFTVESAPGRGTSLRVWIPTSR